MSSLSATLLPHMPPLQVSYETLIAAYGMSGLADKAEAAFDRMRAAGELHHLARGHSLAMACRSALAAVACLVVTCAWGAFGASRGRAPCCTSGSSPSALPARLPRCPPAGFAPRDYAYCGLIAAHSFKGDWAAALRVRERMRAAGVVPTVHVSIFVRTHVPVAACIVVMLGSGALGWCRYSSAAVQHSC